MAEKYYLDAEGLARLKEYIDNQIQPLKTAITLLNGNNETPGSIQQMIDVAVNNLTLNNIPQDDEVTVYGGSAPEEEA